MLTRASTCSLTECKLSGVSHSDLEGELLLILSKWEHYFFNYVSLQGHVQDPLPLECVVLKGSPMTDDGNI